MTFTTRAVLVIFVLVVVVVVVVVVGGVVVVSFFEETCQNAMSRAGSRRNMNIVKTSSENYPAKLLVLNDYATP